MLVIIIILVIINIFLGYAIYNLLTKVEKYEDITVDQTEYLQTISNISKSCLVLNIVKTASAIFFSLSLINNSSNLS